MIERLWPNRRSRSAAKTTPDRKTRRSSDLFEEGGGRKLGVRPLVSSPLLPRIRYDRTIMAESKITKRSEDHTRSEDTTLFRSIRGRGGEETRGPTPSFLPPPSSNSL